MTTSSASSASNDAYDSWQDLDDALQSIVELSRGDLAEASFYQQLLERCARVLKCESASLWRLTTTGTWQHLLALPGPADQLRLQPERVENIAESGVPLLVFETPAQQQLSSKHAALVCPIRIEDTVAAIVEMWKPANGSAEILQRDLQFLEAACEMAEDYHGHQELRRLKNSELHWRELSPFVERVHSSLDPTTVSFAIANEGRRLLDCDRLSVVLYESGSGKARLTSVSGQSTIDPRANAVRQLEKLATTVRSKSDVFWPSPTSATPPSDSIQAFIDETACTQLAVLNLALESEDTQAPVPTMASPGVLVLEQFQSQIPLDQLQSRLHGMRPHCARALHNAREHHDQPFHRITSRLKPLFNSGGRTRRRKRLLTVTLLLTGLVALGMIPIQLTIPAEGRLLPAHRQHVFAKASGVVRELKTKHGRHVEKGEVLATLSSSELDFEIAESLGALQTAGKRLSTIRSARLAMTPSDANTRREYNRLTAEEEATKAEIEGLKQQQAILNQRQRSLMIQSPLSGTVLTWDIARKLEARPVQRGEILMTVAQLDNTWVVELDVPDDRIGYLRQARGAEPTALPVELVFATNPTIKYHATVHAIALRSEPDQQGHPTVRVTAELNQPVQTELRPGAMVVARIQCGPRPLGFVWFHDLWEVIRTRVLF